MTMIKMLAGLGLVLTLAACQATTERARTAEIGVSGVAVTGVSRAASAGNALSLTSQQRARHGLGVLRSDPRLQRAAQVLADHMARNATVGHEGPGGSRMVHRMKRAGYNPCYGVENVAFGLNSPAEVVEAWMRSPGHRKNMLAGRATDGAIAVAVDGSGHRYWAMVAATHCRR